MVVASGSGRASGSALVAAPLHTAGNQILDANNQPVRLRGLTRPLWQTRAATEDEIDHLRGWGANVIRVTLAEDAWNQQCLTTNYDTSYRSYIHDVVSWITSRGMIALLELTVNPRFICDPNADSKQKMADFPGSVTMWQSVARVYKSNPLVAFELYNEPHDTTDEVWLHGGSVVDGAVVWQAAGMQQLYNAVRGEGANNLVFVDGTHWAATPPALRVNGYNVAYAAHIYTCPDNPPPNCTVVKKFGPNGMLWLRVPVDNPYDPTPVMDRFNSLAATNPLVISEFGWPDPNNGKYNANVVTAAEARGWSWMAYAALGTPTGRFSLVADTGPNYDPTPAGLPVKDGLALNP
jgi:hypothetical protein